ncbi:DUF2970 domain-containing protein [Shewanella sedimentimangrovi]|uniref:DUF2970 domain-containing protein n=1 Tax=Shewanella sedimentimangrovi TaxID=2814293 RepID=A0ABX7QZQ6_9GAMM|nr:DUF2970 domain-containing protein [Shewanella sedimentimangrovi]QSX37032.1 DUF2970 domain-containing protein [Shewanella sedimentimangrovi]
MQSSFWQVFLSTLAAFFGVQSDQNRRKDFSQASPMPYIIMGLVLAIGLVLGLVLLVSVVLAP